MAWRSGSLSRALLNTTRSPAIRSFAGDPATSQSLRTPPSLPFSSPLRQSRGSSFANRRTFGDLGCAQSLMPLHSVVADTRLTSHIAAAARACCELSQASMSRWKGSLTKVNDVMSSRKLIHTTGVKEAENIGAPGSMAFIREVLQKDRKDYLGGSYLGQHNTEEKLEKLDVVHVKMIKNNTFVTITDSNGNKKVGASSGCLEEMKGGPKLSRYAAEATAEHVGRLARNLGLKSVVMRVNGFTHFKKKKQAILSWREGYTFGRGDQSPIAYIEDTTRRAHNGCRLPKKRRV